MAKYTKKDIKQDIKNLGIIETDVLVVHSSMKSIGEVEGGADTVIDSFIESISDDGLLIFPTLTYKIMKDGDVYDPQNTPSTVGILPEIFRKREGVVRSLHPWQSMAAKGNRAKNLIAGEEKCQIPCPKDGAWARLYDYNAKLLFIGCSLTRNTFLHSVEAVCDVPNRIGTEVMNFKIKMPNGSLMDSKFRNHDTVLRAHDNYNKIETFIFDKEIGTIGNVGKARAVLLDARKLRDYLTEILKDDPDYFGKKN